MSIVTIAVTLFDLIVASALCVTQNIKSTAERPGSATNSCGSTALCFIASQDIRLAISLSNPLRNLESSDMRRHPFGLERSHPFLGRSTTPTTLNGVGKYPKFKHAWKRSLIYVPIVLQQALSSQTLILSYPGAVSLLPMVDAVTSSNEPSPLHGIYFG